MDNVIRWIFGVVALLLLLYAVVLYGTVTVRLKTAETELSGLKETGRALREENEELSKLLASIEDDFE